MWKQVIPEDPPMADISKERLQEILDNTDWLDAWPNIDLVVDDREWIAMIRELQSSRGEIERLREQVRVPTAAMIEAGYRAYYETPAGYECDPVLLHRFSDVYRAMIAAAAQDESHE